MPAKLSPKQLEETMTTALEIARAFWKKAEYPRIIEGHNTETGKIALSILACKLFDELAK